MKYIFVSLFLYSNLLAYRTVTTLGITESQIVVCEHGYLMQIRTKKIDGNLVTVESTYCDSRSSWDNSCNHEPYKCETKGK